MFCQGQSRQHAPQGVGVAPGASIRCYLFLFCPAVFLFYCAFRQTNLDVAQVALHAKREQTNHSLCLSPSLTYPLSFFLFAPFPSAYHMPTSLIDLALLLVSPCFVTPVWTSLFFFVVSFLYVYRCGARPWSPNPQEEAESFSAFVSVVWSLPHVHALLGCLCLASVKLFSKHHTVPRQNVMNFN